MFGIPEIDSWIVHTRDRPFNDRRYAVDGSKLRKLGWTQSTTFEEGLAATVEWYRTFSGWWGNIDNVLTAFPVVKGDHVIKETSHVAEQAAGLGAENNHAAAKLPNGKEVPNGLKSGAKAKKSKADSMA